MHTDRSREHAVGSPPHPLAEVDLPKPDALARNDSRFRRRVATVAGITALTLVLLVLLRDLLPVLLLAYAGVLLAVLLRAPSDWVSERTGVPARVALAAVVLVLAGGVALAIWLVAPRLLRETDALVRSLPALVGNLEALLTSYSWGQWFVAQSPPMSDLLPSPGGIVTRLTGIVSTGLDVLVQVVVVLFAGLYFAVNPQLYIGGLVALVAPPHRARAHHVVRAVGHTLRWWLLGKAFAMTVIGVLSGVGLWLLGVPLALTLGVFAGLVEFIPTIGPAIALIPALLVALGESPTLALYVFLLYMGLQAFEGYVLSPLVAQHTVDLPPALLLLAIFAFGLLFGPLGVFLAAPLTAALLVLVKLLYVEDALGDSVEVKGLEDDAA